jgi:hypothetical protein
MCDNPFFADGQSKDFPVLDNMSPSQERSSDSEWDLLEEERISSEDGDTDSTSWESLQSPTSWAQIVKSKKQESKKDSKRAHPCAVMCVARCFDSKTTAAQGKCQEDDWRMDAGETYTLFVGDADYVKRSRRTKQNAASRHKRLDRKISKHQAAEDTQ